MKFLYKIGGIFGIVRPQTMEDPAKVAQKLAQLNLEDWVKSGGQTAAIQPAPIPQVWQAYSGYSAMTGFDFNTGKGAPLFNANSGVPIKVFRNTQTGEVRTFEAFRFEQ